MKKFCTLLLVVALVLSLASCGNNTQPSTNNEDGTASQLNVGIYASDIFVGSFDTTSLWCSSDTCGYGIGYLVYDQLFFVNGEGDYSSRIIENYEWTDDTTLVIQLKDNVYFSNGSQLTGDDVLFTLESIIEAGGKPGANYDMWLTDECTCSEDGLTLTLVARQPYATFQGSLDFSILCADYVEEMGGENIDWYDPSQVVGSGPYSCTELISGSSSTFEKREDYWGLEEGYDTPLQTIKVTNYSDQSTMSIDLETGNIDLAVDIAATDYDRLAEISDDNIQVSLIDGSVTYACVFDVNNNEYLADSAVREALCYAVDTEALTTAAAGSYGSVALSMLGVNELGFIETDYDYDPDYAKSVLENAGYSDGEISLHVQIIGSEPYTSIVEILQSYWSEIGVALEIESLDQATYLSSVRTPGNSDIMIYTTSGGNPSGDPSNHLDGWSSQSRYPILNRGEEYGNLVSMAQSTLDEETRVGYLQQLQNLWHDNFDALPLYEYKMGYAYNTDVIEELKLASTQYVWLHDIVLAS